MLPKKRKRQHYEGNSEDEIPSLKKVQIFSAVSFRKTLQGDDAVAGDTNNYFILELFSY